MKAALLYHNLETTKTLHTHFEGIRDQQNPIDQAWSFHKSLENDWPHPWVPTVVADDEARIDRGVRATKQMLGEPVSEQPYTEEDQP